MRRKEITHQVSFFLIWWNKKPWFELAEVLMESKPKDQSGVCEEHKGHGQDSHWEGRKYLNSLTMTKWWEPVTLSGKKPSFHSGTCLIPDQQEHSFLRSLVRELWAVLYTDSGNYFSQFHTKQGYELQSGQQCVGLKQSWKARERQAAVGGRAPTARLTPGLGLAHCLYSSWWIGAPNTVRVPGSFAFFLICVHYHLLNKRAQLFTAVSTWLSGAVSPIPISSQLKRRGLLAAAQGFCWLKILLGDTWFSINSWYLIPVRHFFPCWCREEG